MSRKIILTCAVTGENRYNKEHPDFPVTPEQIADAAFEAQEAGASAVHLHVRNPQTGGGSRDPALFRELAERLRSRHFRAVMNTAKG
jgi:uncharacterized protein (DUF849 family)